MKPRRVTDYRDVLDFLLAQSPGVFHATVLHDEECTPSRCVCEPDYVVEEATAENLTLGAKRQAAWIRSKAS